MTLSQIIKQYIPDLKEATLLESVGDFYLFKITRGDTDSTEQYVCLYRISDYAPDPLEPLGNMGGLEDSLGKQVEGCFIAGSGNVVAIAQLEDEPSIRKKRDFYFFDSGNALYPESGQGYLLYLLY